MESVQAELFREHVLRLESDLVAALDRWSRAGGAGDGVVLDAGTAFAYPRDDQSAPFRPCPHFARWAPDPGPGDLLLLRPGERPRWLRVVERDYWHEPRSLPSHPVVDSFVVHEVGTREQALRELGDVSGCAYLGWDPELADALHIDAHAREPAALLASLDWDRAYKTRYEIACLETAAERAGRGHRAVLEGARARESERGLHLRYLRASELLEAETPYPNIIAWDDRAAILHYQTRRRTAPSPGCVLLIDAGASAHGVHCDITRTHVFEAPAPFEALRRGMGELQAELVDQLVPGASFPDLHARALAGVGALLREIGVLRVAVDEALDGGLVDTFLPHGLGHHIGFQVHDVGGRSLGPTGACSEPPAAWPYLRTTRPVEAGHVLTIEPGVYLVPSLLARLRASHSSSVDWDLVERLVPFGGIRIEDDVWVTPAGPRNLTRPWVEGPAPDAPPIPSSRE